jgi:hypothetical protein
LIVDRRPRTSGNESGHRIRYHRHPLVHGDEEPGTGYQRECLRHDRPPHYAPAPGRLCRFRSWQLRGSCGGPPAGTLPQADDVVPVPSTMERTWRATAAMIPLSYSFLLGRCTDADGPLERVSNETNCREIVLFRQARNPGKLHNTVHYNHGTVRPGSASAAQVARRQNPKRGLRRSCAAGVRDAP